MVDNGPLAPSVVSSVFVDRGLVALRYVSSPVAADCPSAQVLIPADLEGKVHLVAAPGVLPGLLSGPGACCVAVAETGGVLQIVLTAAGPDGALDAVIKVERLYAGMTADGSAPGSARQLETKAFSGEVLNMEASPAIMAHVARRGDVQVGPGEWVAGPAAPAAIEGLQILLTKTDPEIEMQVLLAGRQHSWTPWARSGIFLGSRGQARAIVGVRFRLAGPEAAQWVVAAVANFLGSASVSKEGREVELVGPFASDPLVGLRMRVRAVAKERPSSGMITSPTGREQQVRIFRAGTVSR